MGVFRLYECVLGTHAKAEGRRAGGGDVFAVGQPPASLARSTQTPLTPSSATPPVLLSLFPRRATLAGTTREQKDGVAPDIVTYNTCVTIAGQAGRLDEALELLRKASEEGGLELDVVSYRAALGGLRREKRWEAAVKLLGDMQRRGLGPDEVSFFNIFFVFRWRECGRGDACQTCATSCR